MSRKELVVGFTLMFVSSYIDSLRGPILPALQRILDLSAGELSLFLVLGNFAAICTTFLLMRLLHTYDETKLLLVVLICALSIGVTAVLPVNQAWFVGAGLAFGSVNTGVGMFANFMVMRATTPENEARLMSGLHTMYGAASLLVAALIGWLYQHGLSWNIASMLTWIPLLFCIVAIIGKKSHVHEQEHAKAKFGKIHALLLGIFALYVAGEVTTSMWMSTYLVQVRGFSEGLASYYLSGFFLTMTITRTLAFLFATPRWQLPLLWLAALGPVVCFGLALVTSPMLLVAAGVLGPFFPLLLARVKSSFKQEWRAVTVWIVLAIQTMMIFVHLLIGRIAQSTSMETAYLLPLLFLGLLIPSLFIYLKMEQNHRAAALILGAS